MTRLPTCRRTQVFLGTPPVARGGSSAPVELDLVNGGAHVFAEKPVSLAPPDDVIKYTANLEQAAHSHSDGVRRVVNVGYMFRHSAAVAAARSLIEEEADGRVMAVLARYNSACTSSVAVPFTPESACAHVATVHLSLPPLTVMPQTRQSTTRSGGTCASLAGPSWSRYAPRTNVPGQRWHLTRRSLLHLRQATHFVDLARYLGGDVDMGSVSGVSIPATTDIGTLKRVPGVVDEAAIPPEYRLPRVHSATWRFASGAVGTLTHGLLLHGEAYDTGLEVWCDGLRIAFEELYDARKCRIRVRRSGSDDDEVHTFAGDDMYLTQVGAFLTDVEAAREGKPPVGGVLSPFDDAVASYLLSVAIRDKCTAAP